MDSVKRLATLTPDPDRQARVRARCRAQLERKARRRTRIAVPAFIGGVCLFYTAAFVITTLRLEGLLQ